MSEPVPHSDSPRSVAPIPLPNRNAPIVHESAVSEPPRPADGGFALTFGLQDTGTQSRGVPVLGTLSAVFGIAALFKVPVVLAPLALLFALGALLRRQAGLAAIGGISAVVALAISPMFWAVLGLAWLGRWLLG